MKLSTKSRYGTRIIVDLASHFNEQPIQVSEISKRQGISVKYVEQLLRLLKTSGLITSVRGAKGGYILTTSPKAITLGLIVNLFESHSDMIECVNKPERCDMSSDCRARTAWELVNSAFQHILDSITIADIVNGTFTSLDDLDLSWTKKKAKS